MGTTKDAKERPILFSAAMVRAILDGHKTQTRRIVKPQPTSPCCIADEIAWHQGRVTCIWPSDQPGEDGRHDDYFAVCPYGKPGDRLWVRETWCPRSNGMLAIEKIQRPFYRASDEIPPGWKWRPSIHMPRWASRITLEITEVRIERLQGISNQDAAAEGIISCTVPASGCRCNRDAFQALWDSINAKRGPKHIRRRASKGKPTDEWEKKASAAIASGTYAWAANPWVWAVTFKRV